MDRVVFVRVGRMKFYAGSMPGDESPVGGGEYNKEAIGHELYNFKNVGGSLYGYFQPPYKKNQSGPVRVNLSKIDPSHDRDGSLNKATVIFVACAAKGGQTIVGWYQKATLYHVFQDEIRNLKRGSFRYNLKAPASHSVLLPMYARHLSVPRGAGGFGQANICYPHNSDGSSRLAGSSKYQWMLDAVSYVREYDGANLLTDPTADDVREVEAAFENTSVQSGGQGRMVDAKTRKKIENHAVQKAIRYFKKKGYAVAPNFRTTG